MNAAKPRPATSKLARKLADLFIEEYDLGLHIEDVAEKHFAYLPDDDFLAAVEEARRLAAIDSYRSAFGLGPKLTASGWPAA